LVYSVSNFSHDWSVSNFGLFSTVSSLIFLCFAFGLIPFSGVATDGVKKAIPNYQEAIINARSTCSAELFCSAPKSLCHNEIVQIVGRAQEMRRGM
jgi:hypothetical protein